MQSLDLDCNLSAERCGECKEFKSTLWRKEKRRNPLINLIPSHHIISLCIPLSGHAAAASLASGGLASLWRNRKRTAVPYFDWGCECLAWWFCVFLHFKRQNFGRMWWLTFTLKQQAQMILVDSPILIGMICAVSAIWRNFWQGTTVLKLKLPGAQTRLDGIRSLNVEHGGKNWTLFPVCILASPCNSMCSRFCRRQEAGNLTSWIPRSHQESAGKPRQSTCRCRRYSCAQCLFAASNKAAVLEDLEGMIKHLDYSRISRKVNLCQGPLFRGNGPAWSSSGLDNTWNYCVYQKYLLTCRRNLFDMDRFIYAGWMIDVSWCI